MNITMSRLSAEMTRIQLADRIKELLEMEEQHTVGRADTWKDIPNWTCGCSSAVIDSLMSAHNAIVHAASQECIDCVGETCSLHQTITSSFDLPFLV